MIQKLKKKITILFLAVIAIAVLFGTAYVAIQLIKKNNESHMTKEEQLKFYSRINEQESF